MALEHPERPRLDSKNLNKSAPPKRVSSSQPAQKRASGGTGVPAAAAPKKPSDRQPVQPAAKAPAAAPQARPAPVTQKPASAGTSVGVPRRVAEGQARPATEALSAPAAPKAATQPKAGVTQTAVPKRPSGAQARPASERKAAVAAPPATPKPPVSPEPSAEVAKSAAISVRVKAPVSPETERKRWTAIVAVLAVACVALGSSAAWLWVVKPAASPEAAAKSPPDGGKGSAAARTVASKGSDVPPDENKPAAKFLARDDKRGGSWKNVVGKDGYVIFNKLGAGQHEMKLPDYLGECSSTGEHHVWGVDQDPRGLEDPIDKSRRYRTCEYSNSDFMISFKTVRPVTYRVSFYCVDGDKLGRKHRAEVLADEKVLHTIDVDKMENGVWLQYEITGSVDVRFTNLGNYNAVVAGVFFDTPDEQKIAKRSPPKGPGPENETGLQQGVMAEYFDKIPAYANVKDVATCRRPETSLAFGSMQPLQPGQGLEGWPFAGACSAIFGGYIKIAADGPHTFFLESDDGSRLYIDGELAVDNDGRHPMKEAAKQLELKAGMHRIWVEYFNSSAPMGLNVFLKTKDGQKGPIPEGMLFHDPAEALSENVKSDPMLAKR